MTAAAISTRARQETQFQRGASAAILSRSSPPGGARSCGACRVPAWRRPPRARTPGGSRMANSSNSGRRRRCPRGGSGHRERVLSAEGLRRHRREVWPAADVRRRKTASHQTGVRSSSARDPAASRVSHDGNLRHGHVIGKDSACRAWRSAAGTSAFDDDIDQLVLDHDDLHDLLADQRFPHLLIVERGLADGLVFARRRATMRRRAPCR